ncbi:hypothetical protein [Litorisediminicola beolgyonensis]|uniref:DUF4177 domain-containing protein n=1 Tax=Litorisediminicola beolgyonensis TaxID=1173614 RepID=A0ABW3ZFS1_9RHOB
MRYALVFMALLAPSLAQAACYADYKAKRTDPLRLHYGVAEIDAPCDKRSAADALRPRLRDAGWELLTIVSVFDADGLEERKDSAGSNYLRY